MPKKDILLQINNEKQLNKLCERIVDGLFDNGAVDRQGHYGISKTQTLIAIKEIILNNKNPLLELDRLTYLSWDANDDSSYGQILVDDKDVALWSKALQHKNFWNIDVLFSEDEINEINSFVIRSKATVKELKEYKYRRKEASTYTSNRKVRERILKKYNHKCAICGSKKNLTIDHIIPVLLGGTNDDDNLQVLCRSCNSSKGSKKGKKK